MSYAEQIINQMGVNKLIYADNLAFFGFDSYVYKNYELMHEILTSKIAFKNPVVAYYAMLWCKENGIDFTQYISVGDQISFYHKGIGINITMDVVDIKYSKVVLVNHYIDFSMRPTLYGDIVTIDNTPETSTHYSNWQSTQWLNSNAIYGKWWSKKYNEDNYNESQDIDDKTMLNMCGFLYGLDDLFVSSMKIDSLTNNKVDYLLTQDIETGLKLFADDYTANGGLAYKTMRKTSKFWADTYKNVIYAGTINRSITAPLRTSTSKKVFDELTNGLQYNISNWIEGGGVFNVENSSITENTRVVNGTGQNHISPVVYKIEIQY